MYYASLTQYIRSSTCLGWEWWCLGNHKLYYLSPQCNSSFFLLQKSPLGLHSFLVTMTGSQIRTSAMAKRNQSDQVLKSIVSCLSQAFSHPWVIAQKSATFLPKDCTSILYASAISLKCIHFLRLPLFFLDFIVVAVWKHTMQLRRIVKPLFCFLSRTINGNRTWNIKNWGWLPLLLWVNRSKVGNYLVFPLLPKWKWV